MRKARIELGRWTRSRKQPAFERLAEALERNNRDSNAERIRRMRALYFADVDELQKSGNVEIPILAGGQHEQQKEED